MFIFSFADKIADKKLKMVICDESHSIKSLCSQRTRSIGPILENASRIIMISGTPASTNLEDFYAQVHPLDQQLFPSYKWFVDKFCVVKKFGNRTAVVGSKNEAEFATLLNKVLIRRNKSEVLTHLPSKIRQRVLVALPKSIASDMIRKYRMVFSSL